MMGIGNPRVQIFSGRNSLYFVYDEFITNIYTFIF